MEEQIRTAARLKTQTQVRVGLGVVVFLAAASIVLGAIQISRTIKAPFLPKTSGQALSDLPSEDQRKEEMKKLDTDKDGLTDYDETYIYNTSPFIEDSDSDGVPDKIEVLSGEDPNCPKGRICFAPQVTTSTPSSSDDTKDNLSSFSPAQPDLQSSLGNLSGDPKDLRIEMEKLGIPKDLLAKFSDVDLEKLYLETLKEVIATSTKPN